MLWTLAVKKFSSGIKFDIPEENFLYPLSLLLTRIDNFISKEVLPRTHPMNYR